MHCKLTLSLWHTVSFEHLPILLSMELMRRHMHLHFQTPLCSNCSFEDLELTDSGVRSSPVECAPLLPNSTGSYPRLQMSWVNGRTKGGPRISTPSRCLIQDICTDCWIQFTLIIAKLISILWLGVTCRKYSTWGASLGLMLSAALKTAYRASSQNTTL